MDGCECHHHNNPSCFLQDQKLPFTQWAKPHMERDVDVMWKGKGRHEMWYVMSCDHGYMATIMASIMTWRGMQLRDHFGQPTSMYGHFARPPRWLPSHIPHGSWLQIQAILLIFLSMWTFWLMEYSVPILLFFFFFQTWIRIEHVNTNIKNIF